MPRHVPIVNRLASYENWLGDIDRKLFVLIWLVGINLGLTFAVLVISFMSR